jgi:VanZ family protein
MQNMPAVDSSSRSALAWAGLGYLAFVIYGSLVPLDFRPLPWEQAWLRFQAIPYLQLGIGSRADWVANIVLFIPLTFLWSGALWSRSNPALRILACILIVAGGVALSVGIEFAQIYFPPRTVSLNDILAETIGSAIGVALWLAAGRRLVALGTVVGAGGPGTVRAMLTLYLIGYFALSFFPYDFLVSWPEFLAKLAAHRDSLFVSAGSCDSGLRCAAKLLAEVVAVLPLGLLIGMRFRGGARALSVALLSGAAFGVVIEGVQLFISSGSAEGISVLTRTVGTVSGLMLYRALGALTTRTLQPYLRPGILILLPCYLVFLGVLSGWHGGTRLAMDEALGRIPQLHFLPFYYHYYTSEGVALVSALLNVSLYLPVGLAYWAWLTGDRGKRRAGSFNQAGLLGGILGFAVEVSKLFLAAQRPDPTNILLAFCAAALAYAVATLVMRSADSTETAPAPTPPVRQPVREIAVAARWGYRLFSLPLFALAGWGVYAYPLGWGWLLLGFVAYAALLSRYFSTWLIVVPALLPVFDLAPWSGRFFFDEFDLLLLVTLAVGMWRAAENANARLPAAFAVLLALFAVSGGIALLTGVLPLQAIDANAFSSYYSHYNGLRVAKGLVWALALLPLLRRSVGKGDDVLRLFALGMTLGLASVVVVTLWERLAFPGLLNFTNDYRVTASFSAMHTGGAFVEAYLVTALPFAAAWILLARNLLLRAAALGLFGLGVYALMATFSRGGYAALAVGTLILVVGMTLHGLRRQAWGKAATALPVLLGVAALAALPVLQGSYIQSRFATLSQDFGIRKAHWIDALHMISPGWQTTLFGMGLGRYPETYYWNNSEGVAPATYQLAREGGNTYLRLGAGDSLYFEQIVALQPQRNYVLSFDMRSQHPGAELTTPLCEKWMLYSLRCQWLTTAIRANGRAWGHYEVPFDSKALGAEPWYSRRTVKLSLYNQRQGTLIDVDNVRLVDREGRNLVANGDFSQGSDRWFFSTDNHLPWHLKNLWVEILFEQGWFGLLAFAALVLYSLAQLAAQAWRGRPFSAVLLASLGGFLTVGVVDSLFDAPRFTLLFFLILLSGAFAARQQASSPSATPDKKTVQRHMRKRQQRPKQRNQESQPGDI